MAGGLNLTNVNGKEPISGEIASSRHLTALRIPEPIGYLLVWVV